jgi:hypothetical protein
MKNKTGHKKNLLGSICLLILICFSCSSEVQTENEMLNSKAAECQTLTLSGSFFPDEVLVISYNDSVILKQKLDSTVSGYRYGKDFCLHLTDTFKLKLQTFYKSKLVLDTTFTGYGAEEYYSVSTSLPHPLSNEGYIENGKIIKEWGYLPIDSSRRYMQLTPRSAMHPVE